MKYVYLAMNSKPVFDGWLTDEEYTEFLMCDPEPSCLLYVTGDEAGDVEVNNGTYDNGRSDRPYPQT